MNLDFVPYSKKEGKKKGITRECVRKMQKFNPKKKFNEKKWWYCFVTDNGCSVILLSLSSTTMLLMAMGSHAILQEI